MPTCSLTRRLSLLFGSIAVAALVSLAGCESRNAGTSDGTSESAAANENGTSKPRQPADAPADSGDVGEEVTSSSSGERTDTLSGEKTNSSNEKTESKQSEKSDSDVATSGDAAAKKVPPGVDPLLIGKPRPDTAGWWRIVFSVPSRQDFPNDYSAGFIKVGKAADGTYRVEEVRTNFIVDPAKVVKSEATDKTVRLFFEHNDLKFDYEGTLDAGIIRGTLQFNSPRQNLVRLTPVSEAVATDDDTLEKAQLGTTFGSEELYGVISGDDRVEKLEDLAKTWRKSPVLFHIHDLLLQNSAEFGFDRPQIERLIKGFESAAAPWGDRAVAAAKLSAAADLLLSGTETSIADAKIDEVQKNSPQLVESWQELLESLRKRGENAKAERERVAALDAAVKQVESKDAAEVEKGITTLRELHAKKPADPLATYRLAAALQSQGADDEALDLFARLAALPQTELELGAVTAEASYRPARVVAARLYEKARGSRDGFDAFLRTTYKQALTSFLTDKDRDRKQTESTRLTLVEMFTGAECPPCVAADVATDAIEQSFPRADVAVLRYHVHIPGPDPLSSPDSLARKDYYAAEVAGTPTILIDGQLVEYNVGGAYSNAPNIYEELASTVSESTAQPPEGSIDLKASVAGEKLSINVSASAPEKPADTVRLRIVIAESEIDFSASNGIKEHEMVVREMPGGAAGIAAVQGQFSFQQEIPLVELRDRLNDGLTTAEQQLSQEYGERVKFRTRPLDLRRLTVVAFLQDDTTREILQAAVVPIDSDIELPPLETASATDAPKPTGEEDGDAQPAPPEPSEKSDELAPAGPDLKGPE